MKKLFLIVLLFSTIICFAQQKKEAKNEVRIQLIESLYRANPAMSYERILTNLSSAGVYIKYHIDNNLIDYEDESDYLIKNMVMPYYRIYFNNKKGSSTGTFIEGNCAFYSLNVKDNLDYWEHFNDNNENNYFKEKNINIGIGFAFGRKWKTKSNWIVEFNLGFGRNLSYNKFNYYYRTSNNQDVIMFYPRAGLSVGKRF
jgi:hypothetical protein